MTLIEVTLVISVLLGMVGSLFLGVSSYKEGTNRAFCIQNIASLQKAVRSYSNMNDLRPGSTIPGFKGRIIGPGLYFESDPVCPSEGTYSYGGDVIPDTGEVYLKCSIATHEPKSSASW